MYDHHIFILLAGLFFKHWLIDFVWQSKEEIQHKGIYGNWLGLKHSVKHGIGTMIVFFFGDPAVYGLILIGMLDFIIHYHIDWFKVRFGTKDSTTNVFWAQFGLDQMLHYFTYLWLVWLVL